MERLRVGLYNATTLLVSMARAVSTLRVYEACSVFSGHSRWIHAVRVHQAVYHGGDVSMLVVSSCGGVCNDVDDKFAGHLVRVM